MKCMHCLIEFHPQAYNISIGQDIDGHWRIAAYYCPSCRKVNLYLLQFEKIEGSNQLGELISETLIHPRGSHRPPCPPEVPIDYANDYTEACITLPDSSKASAALSRRCLQSLLRETVGVKKSDLAKEIQEAIDSRKLPSHLIDIIDAVRNIGNFAAHPIKSQSTGEIVDVEPGEAELNLDVLEALFDFYFVQPVVVRKKKDALNKKLTDAGKPVIP